MCLILIVNEIGYTLMQTNSNATFADETLP
jgi:hypothetical protein